MGGRLGEWVVRFSYDLCISILTNICTMLEKHAWHKPCTDITA